MHNRNKNIAVGAQNDIGNIRNDSTYLPKCARTISLFLCLSWGIGGYCQQVRIDSLLLLIENTNNDTNEVNSLNGLCLLYIQIGKMDTALDFGNKALALSEQLKDARGTTDALNNLGAVYFSKRQFPASLDCYHKALLTIKTNNNTKVQYALICDNIGLVYEAQGNYFHALNYFANALKTVDGIENKQLQAYTLNSIADLYANHGKYSRALEYYQKAIELNKEFGNKSEMAKEFNNIGVVYKAENDYPHALQFYFKAIRIAEETGDKLVQINILDNISTIYREKGDCSNELEYSMQALKMASQLKSPQVEMTTATNVAHAYWKKSDYSEALKYYAVAFADADSTNDKNSEGVIADNMGIICESQGDYPKALEYEFKALAFSTAISDKGAMAINKNTIGEVYEKQKNYKEAEKYILQALYLADTVQLLQTVAESNLELSNLFAQTGEGEKSYKAFTQYILAKDKLSAKTYNEITERVQWSTDYETNLIVQGLINERDTALEAISEKKKKAVLSLALFLTLAISSITFIQIRMRILATGSKKDSIEKDYFVIYLPQSHETRKFCRLEEVADITLVFFGKPDAVEQAVKVHALEKIFSEATNAQPEMVLAKSRELINLNIKSPNQNLSGIKDLFLMVINRKTAFICWEDFDMALWVVCKTGVQEISPIEPKNYNTFDAPKNFSFHANKGDALYVFSKEWITQLWIKNEAGVNLFQQKLQEICTLQMDVQRKIMEESVVKNLDGTVFSDDILIMGMRI